ncbi:unnamed protein product, partial [Dicrocoelium dendriticum]
MNCWTPASQELLQVVTFVQWNAWKLSSPQAKENKKIRAASPSGSASKELCEPQVTSILKEGGSIWRTASRDSFIVTELDSYFYSSFFLFLDCCSNALLGSPDWYIRVIVNGRSSSCPSHLRCLQEHILLAFFFSSLFYSVMLKEYLVSHHYCTSLQVLGVHSLFVVCFVTF